MVLASLLYVAVNDTVEHVFLDPLDFIVCTDFSATVPATVPPPPLWSLDVAKLYSIDDDPLVILLGELVTVAVAPPRVEDVAAAGVLLAPRRDEEEAVGPPLREGVTDGDTPTSTVDARLYPLLERLAWVI